MPVCVYVFPFSEILCSCSLLVCSVVLVVSDISESTEFLVDIYYCRPVQLMLLSCFCLYFSLVYITFHSVVFLFPDPSRCCPHLGGSIVLSGLRA